MSKDLKRYIIHMPENPETMQDFIIAIQHLNNRRRAF